MDATLAQAKALKQNLTDFILDAEDELAVALEQYSATQLSRSQQPDMHRRTFVVDRFLMEGQVGSATPIDLFTEQFEAELSETDRLLLQNWRRSFLGLFSVQQVLEDGLELVNSTTAKLYRVRLTAEEQQAVAKFKEGDILLVQIAPMLEDWMFASQWISLGRLGKPKLAVAIGNFKQNYKEHLYSDAPELLAEAWHSVEKHYQNFTDFFGSDEVTLPGYQLGKKLSDFQTAMLEKQFEEAGIDQSKSFEELVTEAGVSQAEMEEAAEALGTDAKLLNQVIDTKQAPKMMMPAIELPPHLKKAEQVTILTHPRWGQAFLPHYMQFTTLLTSAATEPDPAAASLVKKYLEDPEIPAFVWHRLAQQYPSQLEALLQTVLEKPEFQLTTDLDPLLQASGKNLQTELPEIASVPLHLHNLFQEAVLEVSKDKSKKKKPKPGHGFKP